MPDPSFVSLLLLTGLAFLVPLCVKHLGRPWRVPIVVGEILAGIAVGKSGLDLLQETPSIAFLANLGFLLLMFLSGLELEFGHGAAEPGRPRPRWQRPLWLGSAMFAVTLALAMGVGTLLWAAGMSRNPILLGLILSTTSLGVVVPVLKDRGLLPTAYGQCLLAASLVSDFVPMLLLGLLTSVFSRGFSWNLLLFVGLLAAFVAAARTTRWATRHGAARSILGELAHGTAQIRVRGTFALLAAWVVLAGSMGVELILGAFLAGATLAHARSGERGEYEQQLDAIGYGVFIPMFFLMVGARFDVAALLGSRQTMLLAPLLVLASYAVNILPALLLRVRFSRREALAGGLLLASRLSLAIAAAQVAFQLDLITAGTNAAIVLVAVVTCTLSPVLFERVLPEAPGRQRRGILIVGTDALAELLGKRLQRSGEPLVFLGRDADRLDQLHGDGCRTVPGRPDDEQVLAEAGAQDARALVAVSNDPDTVLRACRIAVERFRVPIVIARAETPGQTRALQAMSVRVVQPAMALALALEGALCFPHAIPLLAAGSDEFDLAEVPLQHPDFVDRSLRQVSIPGRALVLAVRRCGAGEIVVPHGDTILHRGDVLVLCGSQANLELARTRLGAG